MNTVELITDGEYADLSKRGISEETCRKFGYTKGRYKDKPCQIANYYDNSGELAAQKLRFAGKDFLILGDMKKATGFFGSHLYGKGKMIVITEGEIDALSVAQVQDCKWPVVSVPNGAAGAKRAIAKNLDYLSNFETVVLMFDNDEPGKAAAAECAEVLGPKRCKIATLPLKDANEMLLAGRVGEMTKAIWDARPYQPDGVLAGSDMWGLVESGDSSSEAIPYPWVKLNEMTDGLRTSEVVTFTAGTGSGKSALVRELSYYLGNKANQKVGLIMLEESSFRTAIGLMGLHADRPLHRPKYREGVPPEEMKKWFEATLGTGNYFLIDHWGSTDLKTLMNRIRYLVVGCGCKYVVLDHISIIMSGLALNDERKELDKAITDLSTLVREIDCGLLLVSHLSRPEGKGHENGAEVQLRHLRGSHAVAQLSDTIIAVERDQQGETPNLSTIRVLKNRFTGETGIATYLMYDRETGRLFETTPEFAERESKDDFSQPVNTTGEGEF